MLYEILRNIFCQNTIFDLLEANSQCDFFIQYLVDIFEYIRCSITQYSADLHLQVNRNVGKMSFA